MYLVMASEKGAIEDAIAESMYTGCGVKVVRSYRFGLIYAKVSPDIPFQEMHEFFVD